VCREIPRLVELMRPEFITLEEVPGFTIHTFPANSLLLWEEARRQRQQHKKLLQQQQQQQQEEQQGPFFAAAAAAGAASASCLAAAADDDSGSESEGKGEDDSSSSSDNEAADDGDDLRGVEDAMAAATVGPDAEGADKVVFHPCTLVVGPLPSLGYQVGLIL
jgi:hypothetical protein